MPHFGWRALIHKVLPPKLLTYPFLENGAAVNHQSLDESSLPDTVLPLTDESGSLHYK
jgi:hypothetical protein